MGGRSRPAEQLLEGHLRGELELLVGSHQHRGVVPRHEGHPFIGTPIQLVEALDHMPKVQQGRLARLARLMEDVIPKQSQRMGLAPLDPEHHPHPSHHRARGSGLGKAQREPGGGLLGEGRASCHAGSSEKLACCARKSNFTSSLKRRPFSSSLDNSFSKAEL